MSKFCTPHAGMLVYAPKFSKYMHGCASLYPDAVESMPYWFLRNDDGTMSTATWDEMAETSDKNNKVASKFQLFIMGEAVLMTSS